MGVGASPWAQIRALGVAGSRTFTEGQMRAACTRVHIHTSVLAHLNSAAHTSTCAYMCVHTRGSVSSSRGSRSLPPPLPGPQLHGVPLEHLPG